MAAGDLFAQHFGQGVRESVDSVDEMVARNIQEVLQAAGNTTHDDPFGPIPSTSDVREERSSRPSQQPQALRRGGSSKAAPSPADPDGAPPMAGPGSFALAAVTAIAGPAGGSTMLDVPGHAEATIRLHKARIKTLEDEVAKLTRALAERDRALSEATKEVKLIKAEQQAWAKDKKAYEAQVERLSRKAGEAEAALASKENAAKEVSKESMRLEKERRAVEQEARARDVRLQRALDDVERYKAMLQELRSQERDGKDLVKADVQRLVADNKKLERQRAELIVAFRKQLKLVDVLKRQRVHLEASRALQFSADEFMQLLGDAGAGGPQ